MEAVDRLDGKNIEPYTTIDDGLCDKDIADDGRAKHREGIGSGRPLELVGRAEGDGALGPPERTCGLEPGEGRIHLMSELLEDVVGGWGLSATQDASDGARLLEAPSPLVLMMVVIPSWRER